MTRRAQAFGLGLAFALALAGGVVDAAVYKWTDVQGATHYDDQSRNSGQQLTRDYVQSRQVTNASEWTGTVPADFVQDVQAHCQASRDRLAGDQEARTLYRRDSRGSVTRLSPAQSRQRIADGQREVASWCGADAPSRLYRERLAAQRAAAAKPTRTVTPVTRR